MCIILDSRHQVYNCHLRMTAIYTVYVCEDCNYQKIATLCGRNM